MFRNHPYFSILALFLLAAIPLTGIALQKPDRLWDLRFPANNKPIEIAEHNKPGNITDSSNKQHVQSVRKNINGEPVPQVFLSAMQLLEETPILIENARQTVVASRKSFLYADVVVPTLTPLLPLDGASRPLLYGNFQGAEALDLEGKPLRWAISPTFLAGLSPPRPWIVPETTPSKEVIPKKFMPGSASSYRELVKTFSARFGLNASLVLAIIHSESNFSPTLVSSKSAMGLMQLLPSTASGEIHRFLYGKSGQIGFEDLRNPELNIRYGTAYLHILHTRYFPNIRNGNIREICVIAAYNLGPNRFIKLYGATPDQAAEVINTMSEEDFVNDLQSRLPVTETRNYVNKVRRMKELYSNGD